MNIQELLLKSFACERRDTELTFTTDNSVNGVWHLRIWRQPSCSPFISPVELTEISTVGKLLLVMPATNVFGERSFSALRRTKTYLSSPTGDSRLSHYMMLHVHKDWTDAPILVDVANDFVGEKDNGKQLFGKFSANDIPNKFSISSKSTQTENLRQEWKVL